MNGLKPKNKLLALFLLALVCQTMQSDTCSACDEGCSSAGCLIASVTFETPESMISADTLAVLLNSGPGITLLECRSGQQKRELRIPGARVIYEGTPVASLTVSLPATDSLIIIYPGLEGGTTASMAADLRALGYLSVLEYHGGVHGWITFGHKAEGE